MKFLAVILLIISLSLYLRAMYTLFSRAHGISNGMRTIQWAGALTGAIHLYAIAHSPQPWMVIAAGLAFYLLALFVFALARQATQAHPLTLAYSPDKPSFLVSTGIYRFVRHPFYLSYMLTWFAGTVSAPGVLTILTTAAMAMLYLVAAIHEEAKFSKSGLASAYAAYRKTTGMFLPRLR